MTESTQKDRVLLGFLPTLSAGSNALFLAARSAVLALALLAITANTLWYQEGRFSDEHLKLLYYPVAGWFAWVGFSALWTRSGKQQRFYTPIQICSDLLLIGWIVWITGGPTSPLHFLFLLFIMGVAILFNRGTGLLTAFAGAGVVATLEAAMMLGIIPGVLGTDLSDITVGAVLLQLIGLSSAMILVAVATSFLKKRLVLTQEIAAQSQSSLAELSQLKAQTDSKLKSVENQLAVHDRMARMISEQESPVSQIARLPQFIGESEVMKRIFALISKAAPSEATVLINGESGTGKELAARALHLGGTRAQGPFVPVNCGAIPENLLESELFGHKKGAFTGADSDTIGLFRKAEGGTIFLDEIGELPLPLQVKLLRALQERSVRPVGAAVDIPINVRVVAATNRNLRKEVVAGKFREDLFYRLNVIAIPLPALTDRRDDIPLLITHTLRRFCKNREVPVFAPTAMELMLRYNYPGNVRELENIIERALVLGGDAILPEHLPESVQLYRPAQGAGETGRAGETQIIIDESLTLPVDLEAVLQRVEKRYIVLALEQSGGVKKRAAELLGINFRSFRYRLQKLEGETPAEE